MKTSLINIESLKVRSSSSFWNIVARRRQLGAKVFKGYTDRRFKHGRFKKERTG